MVFSSCIFSLNHKPHLFLGVYVPLTVEGTIVVDGVLASCYPSVDHDVFHFAMTPIRWFPQMIEWLFGEANRCQHSVTAIEKLGQWMLPYELLYYIQ